MEGNQKEYAISDNFRPEDARNEVCGIRDVSSPAMVRGQGWVRVLVECRNMYESRAESQ